ncbi:MAG: fibronectin type III domain-containing protein [Steroidobacteraceae bacterium]
MPPPTGTALLNWDAPSTRSDGSVFDDLAGYRVNYGVTPDELRCQIEIRDPQLTTWKVIGLSPGTWYFAVVSFDSGFVESEPSGVVSRRID